MGNLGLHELVITITILGVFLLGTAFWLWMVIDCIKHEPEEGNSKMTWVIIICVTSTPGAVIYYFMKKRARHS